MSSTADASSREARKLEQQALRLAAEAARELQRKLKAALREPSPERSADARALLEAHPEETAKLRASAAKAARVKEQQEVNATEVEEDETTLRVKIDALADMLREAKHAVVYTGAGMSTAAAIPDYRGPQGLWTLHNKKGGGSSSAAGGTRNAPCAARVVMGQSFAETRPTIGHLALAALVRKGLIKQVISQNVDGLHLRSGVPPSKLCELHGNVFRERCPSCGKEYVRPFDVTGKSSFHRHGTERVCERKACNRAELRDTIVYFGESIAPADLSTAMEHSERCDLAIFFGSSLKVLQHYKFIWQLPPKPQRKRMVIVNLQPTPKDHAAELRLHGRCDTVLEQLVASLGMTYVPYQPAKDEVLKRQVEPAPGSELMRSKAEREAADAREEAEAAASDASLDEAGEGPPAASAAKTAVKDTDGSVKIETDGAEVAADNAAAAEEARDDGGSDDGHDGDGGDGFDGEVEVEGGGSHRAMPPQKRRKKSGWSTKRRSLPRAFPAGAPPAKAQAEAASIATAPAPASAVDAAAAAAAAAAAPPPPPLKRAASPWLRAPSPRLLARQSSLSSVVGAASSTGTPPPSTSSPLALPVARPPPAEAAPAPAPAPVAPASAAAPAPVAPAVAPAKKCTAKCGFFASSASADGLCSKCSAKRAAELASWHGALSKNKRRQT